LLLNIRQWGGPSADTVVCLHGVAQHGGIFEQLGGRLSARGCSVVAVDLRGHGDSGREPPWDTATHAQDVLETLEEAGVERAALVGHSFGGRLAAAIAAPDRGQCSCPAPPRLRPRTTMMDSTSRALPGHLQTSSQASSISKHR
jgi:lipase